MSPGMRLPRLFRTTPFRLTLLFLALFGAAASAFLAYIYVATAGEATRRTDQDITREMSSLIAAYDRAGVDAVRGQLLKSAGAKHGRKGGRKKPSKNPRPRVATRFVCDSRVSGRGR